MVSEANSNNQESLPKDGDKFVFLPDKPVREDFFGCHERIATSIATQIESNQEGKTIGLEGTWGSGKSSVVEMLEAKWEKEKNNNIRVFKYDAWEHQGDPLRRAFLEELITCLQKGHENSENWIKKCKTVDDDFQSCQECKENKNECPDHTRAKLRLRYEHNVIDTESHISWKGIIFGLLTLAMPICLILMGIVPKWWSIIPGILALLPVIYIIIILAWLKFRKKTSPREIIGEFFGKSRDTTKHTTHRSLDPTTIEFQEYYEKILSLALKNNNHKLVIVVDNLDRVEPETGRAVWGTMRTFLEKSNYKDKEMINRIWVIVPYDAEGIEKLWPDLALHFKEKTFQIRYHVPEPLTSKWEDYFNEKLKEAIKDQKDDTYDNMFHIFRMLALPKYNNIPTPREIKIFINRVVGLAVQFYSKKDATLEEIALYAAMELEGEGELRNLSGNIKDELKIKQFVGDNFKEGLASIHYGVTRSEANEVLYKPAISNAIKQGDSEELEELLQDPAAQKVCNNYIKDEVANLIVLADLTTASSVFSGFSYKECTPHIRRCIQTLAEQLKNIDKKQFKINNDIWGGIDAAGLIKLMEFDPEIIPVLINKFSVRMTKEDFGEEVPEQISRMLDEWVTVVISILEYIKDNTDYDPTITLRLAQPEQYVKLLDIVQKKKKDTLKYFCPIKKLKNEYLRERLKNIEAGNISTKDIDIIDGLLNMNGFEEKDEKVVASSLTKSFLNMSKSIIPIVYEILYKYRNKPSFNEQLRSIAQNNQAFTVLNNFSSNHQVAALCLVNIFLFYDAISSNKGNIPADALQKFEDLLENIPDELAGEIAKTIDKYKLFDDICDSVTDSSVKDNEFWAQILKHIVKEDELIDNISTQRFIKEHEYIKEHLDSNIEGEEINYYEKLVKHLWDKGLTEKLTKEPVSCEYGHAYYITLTEEIVDSKNLEEKLCNELGAIETGVWLEELRNESEYYGLLDVVIMLVEKGRDLELRYNFSHALVEHANALIEKTVKEPDSLKESWKSLLKALTEDERGRFKVKLLEDIIAKNKDISPLLGIYANEIESAINEASEPSRKEFISKTCVRISEDQNKIELYWMLGLLASKFIKAKRRDKGLLKDRLDSFLRDEYKKKESETEEKPIDKEVIKNVAEQLDVTLTEENPENHKEEKEDNDEKPNAESPPKG